jgi:integrase
MRLQDLRPAVLSKLYCDLAEHRGKDSRSLSAWTVSHVHRTLRKALDDAVHVEQLLAVNPAERSKLAALLDHLGPPVPGQLNHA